MPGAVFNREGGGRSNYKPLAVEVVPTPGTAYMHRTLGEILHSKAKCYRRIEYRKESINTMCQMIGDMFRYGIINGVVGVLILLVVTTLILGLILSIVDWTLGKTETISVTVIEKLYSPAKSGTGIVTGVTSSCGFGTGVVFTSEHEKYVLIVKDSIGKVFSHKTDACTFANINKGEVIKIDVRIGGITKERI